MFGYSNSIVKKDIEYHTVFFLSRPWYQPERLVSGQARRARADTIQGLIPGTRSEQQCDVVMLFISYI